MEKLGDYLVYGGEKCSVCGERLGEGQGIKLRVAGVDFVSVCFLCLPRFRRTLWKEVLRP